MGAAGPPLAAASTCATCFWARGVGSSVTTLTPFLFNSTSKVMSSPAPTHTAVVPDMTLDFGTIHPP